jgi:hypothetical protein
MGADENLLKAQFEVRIPVLDDHYVKEFSTVIIGTYSYHDPWRLRPLVLTSAGRMFHGLRNIDDGPVLIINVTSCKLEDTRLFRAWVKAYTSKSTYKFIGEESDIRQENKNRKWC